MNSIAAIPLDKKQTDEIIRALPGLLQEIALITDLETALIIAREKGGQRVYLPLQPKADHWMSKAVGTAMAEKICKSICPGSGGLDIDIPKGVLKSTLRKSHVEKLIL